MSNQFSKLSLSILALSVSVVSWAGNPCMPIAQACMNEGYYKGGDKVGKGLVKDCVMPVVSKQKTVGNNTFSDEVLQQCGATLEKKMQAQSQ
jgi:hypothetical protein